MLNLVSTSDLIQVITGSAVNTIFVVAEFEDGSTVITPSQRQQTAITTATTTTVVSSPAVAGITRAIKSLVIYNSSGSSNAITIQLVNAVPATITLFSYTMLAGETIVYADGSFVVVSSTGLIKSTTAYDVPAAGSTGQVQFNGNPYLAGDSNLFWDNTNKILVLGGSSALKWGTNGGITVSGGAVFNFGTGVGGDHSGNLQASNADFFCDPNVGQNITLVNPHTATSSNNYGGGAFIIGGSYWTGSAPNSDGWNLTQILGTGANPTSTLQWTHSGTTGQLAWQFPSPVVLQWGTDTGLSRDSAGIIDVGNGTAADKSGSINLTNLAATGKISAGAVPTGGVAGDIAACRNGSATSGAYYLGSDGTVYWYRPSGSLLTTTAEVQITPTSGDARLDVSGAASTQSAVHFQKAGADTWSIGRYTDDTFFVFDSTAGKFRIIVTTSGTLHLANGNVALDNLISNYNSIATVSNGVPAEYANKDLTAQSAAQSVVQLYAVPAAGAGMYRITWSAKVTTPATTSCVLGGSTGFQIGYTDADDSVAVTTPAWWGGGNNGAAPTSASTNTTQNQVSGEVIVNAKASTNITFSFGYTSSGATAMQYSLHIKLEAM